MLAVPIINCNIAYHIFIFIRDIHIPRINSFKGCHLVKLFSCYKIDNSVYHIIFISHPHVGCIAIPSFGFNITHKLVSYQTCSF